MKLRSVGILWLLAATLGMPYGRIDFLFQSFDQATAACERQIAELERRTPTAKPRVAPLIAELEAQITVACDAASDYLDLTIARLPDLSPYQRAVVQSCIEQHVRAARHDLEAEVDPRVRTEYLVTYERLQEIQRLV